MITTDVSTIRRTGSILSIVIVLALFFFNPAASDTITACKQAGAYAAHEVYGPYSGLMREDGTVIGSIDDPHSFNFPEHIEADRLWFTSGWVMWDFSPDIPKDSKIQSISFRIETSSEHPGHKWDWPSNLTLNINGVDVDSWVIPGDPGPEYGHGIQENSDKGGSQYGWLPTWTVDTTGTYFEYLFRFGHSHKTKVSDVSLKDIVEDNTENIGVTLSVPDTVSGFGVMIYGDTWGDFDLDPCVTVDYLPSPFDISIDIRPRRHPNCINLRSKGKVPVALLSTEEFNAYDADPATCTFAGASPRRWKMKDVDRDGDTDLLLFFPIKAIELTLDSTEASLEGNTFEGIRFKGTDPVNTFIKKKSCRNTTK